MKTAQTFSRKGLFDAIPSPQGTPEGLLAVVQALKIDVEQLVGTRGNNNSTAVLFGDLSGPLTVVQEVIKGPPGSPGTAGPAGPAGPVGPAGAGVNMVMDVLDVAALNTLPALSQTPNLKFFQLTINGSVFFPVGDSPPFAVAGTAIIWLSTLFSIPPGATVVASYSY